MKRINVYQLMPTKPQRKVLNDLMILSSCIYNSANYIFRQELFNNKDISSFFEKQQALQKSKNYQNLGRSYSLPMLQKHSEVVSAFFALLKYIEVERAKGKEMDDAGIPKYYKNRKTNITIPSYLAVDGIQYKVRKNRIMLPLSRAMRRLTGLKRFKIRYNGTERWVGKQGRGEVHIKNKKFYLYQTIEVATPVKETVGNYAGLDLGANNPFAVYTQDATKRLWTSNRFYKQYVFWSEKIAEKQSELANIGRKTSKSLQRLYDKRRSYCINLENNLIASIFRFLRRKGTKHIFVGDISHIRDDNDKGRATNAKIHNYWSFARKLHKLKCQAENFGIELEPITEEYTSTTCPICHKIDKASRDRNVFCCTGCRFKEHSDIVGAWNIYEKGMHSLQSSQKVHWGEIAPSGVVAL